MFNIHMDAHNVVYTVSYYFSIGMDGAHPDCSRHGGHWRVHTVQMEHQWTKVT